MSAGSVGGGGLGTTAVLGTRIVRGLAQTGLSGIRLLGLIAIGLFSIATGAFLRGKGRRIQAGEPLD